MISGNPDPPMEENMFSGNPDPPPDFIDFEITAGTREIQYFTHFGEPCKWMKYINESDFDFSGSECSELSSLSSDESVDSEGDTRKKNAENKSSSISQSLSASSKTQTTKPKPPVKPESKIRKKHTRRHDSPSRRIVAEYSDSEDSSAEQDIKPRVKKPLSSARKPVKVEDPELDRKPLLGVSGAFGEYHCEVCNITVNSETTLETHMLGKRHRKELKARAIPEVAMQSLALMEKSGTATPPDPKRATKPSRRRLSNEVSFIQGVAENYNKGPVPALSYVTEIRTAVPKECYYYCSVCEAHCQPISIFQHLTGFKHYLNSVGTFDRNSFNKFQGSHKKEVEHLIKRKLEDYEAKNGRGFVVVEQEIPRTYPSYDYDQPGPSWRNYDIEMEGGADSAHQDSECMDITDLSSREDLDMSFHDFYCTVCDSHMNNKSMWEAHVRGKRHLKNKKKIPGENASKIKSVLDPRATAHLTRQLRRSNDIIVGLDFIKETQGENGDLYNCFLCGACTSSFDIENHLISSKHRTKFLEAVNQKGQENDIKAIMAMRELPVNYRDLLIREECDKHFEKYGPGRVQVYKSKDLMSQPHRLR